MDNSTWFNSINLDLNIGHTSRNEKISALEEEIKQKTEENKMLNEKISAMQANYNMMQSQYVKMMSSTTSSNSAMNSSPTRKRSSSSSDEERLSNEEGGQARISKLRVKTSPSDTSLVVKDGYQWRKYGQKVTRDNPYPRAYYKCSFAPLCPVKKKVQRSAEDHSILVATYEGEHTHVRATSIGNTDSNISSSSSANVTRNMTRPEAIRMEDRRSGLNTESEEFKRRLAEQMALSLSNDPGFKEALASAVSEKFIRFSP